MHDVVAHTLSVVVAQADGGRFAPGDDKIFRQWYFRHRRPGLVHRVEQHKRGVMAMLFATVLGHVAAALHHAWIRRDGVFEAMTWGRRPPPGTG